MSRTSNAASSRAARSRGAENLLPFASEVTDGALPASEASSTQLASPRLVPPLKWHGGKFYLAARILNLAPPHLHYVEPFAGGLQVLLARNPVCVSEVVNDVHGNLTNFWKALQDPECFETFRRRIEATPFSEIEYREAVERLINAPRVVAGPIDVARAIDFFISCRMSLAGRMNAFTAITRTRLRREMNNEVSAWTGVVEGLPAVHARLKRLLVLNRDALDVIRSEDGPYTWFYLDPPYLDETRATPEVYAHEMPREKHVELLETLAAIKGRFALSGYRSSLYDEAASKYGWELHEFEIPNQAAAGAKKRRMIECVWVGGGKQLPPLS